MADVDASELPSSPSTEIQSAKDVLASARGRLPANVRARSVGSVVASLVSFSIVIGLFCYAVNLYYVVFFVITGSVVG